MSGEFAAFAILSLMAITGGILMLNVTKVVHMLISLVLTFISIAGLYILLTAEFIAVVQVLIYSGAVTIIMLFGIMLTRKADEEEPDGRRLKKWLVFAGIALFAAVMYTGIYRLDLNGKPAALHENNTEQIGIALFTEHIIPFELTSVLLLAALIGAIILAKKDEEKEEEKS
ncbi:NADH-quinone oxidoreductase subunit J [Bacillus sp. FJAT-42376]|uniref:NADH-quinone oxidoreductase subunit J n=1 Tax=Bacillus sp. FJAT-42376 TaxID=2014076 RepID=UPI000F513928|nr:NADH-quinone oxidoreductase subunit J [Bacillus sp. FJAT-42376]AZB44676.1 NADH-quinone oxidoreductase subunit J [Bacillus sp. FJAT-42376]